MRAALCNLFLAFRFQHFSTIYYMYTQYASSIKVGHRFELREIYYHNLLNWYVIISCVRMIDISILISGGKYHIRCLLGIQRQVIITLRWRHNDHAGVSNHQPNGCLLNRLFRRRSKKTSKLRVAGLCAGNSPGPVNSPHKGPATRKMFSFDDVIMIYASLRYDYL